MEVSADVLEKTGGRLDIQVFPASQLGGDNDLLSQVRSGAVEFFPAPGLILASVLPVTAIDGMGFAFSDYDKIWAAMDGDLGAFVRSEIARQDQSGADGRRCGTSAIARSPTACGRSRPPTTSAG